MRKTASLLALLQSTPLLVAPKRQRAGSATKRPSLTKASRAMAEKAEKAAEVESAFHSLFGIEDRMVRYARQSLASYHQAHASDLAAIRAGGNEAGRSPSLSRKRTRLGEPSSQEAPPPPSASVPAPRTRCYQFFTNQTRSIPGNETVEQLLALGEGKDWAPETLELRHDYIQWLFPLREAGVNWSAPLLTSADAAKIRDDGEAMANVLRGFRLMLRFYGMRLSLFPDPPRATGGPLVTPATLTAEIQRTPARDEFLQCYANLRRSPHNYLRISRILQFLGEVGLEKLKVAWLRFLAHEIVVPDDGLGTATTATARQQLAGDWEDEDEDDCSVYRAAPLGACGYSFASFWVETPYDAHDRLAIMAETLAHHRRAKEGDAGGDGGGHFVVRVSGVPVPPGTLSNAALAPQRRRGEK